MLTQVVAERRRQFPTAVEDSFTFDFVTPGEYLVKDIDGLGQPKSNVGIFNVTNDPGGVFLGSKSEPRNIILTIELKPQFGSGSTISSLRQDLKKVFMPGQAVYLALTDSEIGIVEIDGAVESHDPVIFSDSPEVRISIVCPYPYYRLQGSDETFTFPLDEVFVDHDFLTKVETPYTLEVTFLSDTSDFDFQHLTAFSVWHVEYEFLTGDILTISNIDKQVELNRGGPITNLLGAFTGNLSQGLLHKGLNSFIIPDSDQQQTITYRRTFGGL